MTLAMKNKSLCGDSQAMLFELNEAYNTLANGWLNMSCFSHIQISLTFPLRAPNQPHFLDLSVLAETELNQARHPTQLDQPWRVSKQIKPMTMLIRSQASVSLDILLGVWFKHMQSPISKSTLHGSLTKSNPSTSSLWRPHFSDSVMKIRFMFDLPWI